MKKEDAIIKVEMMDNYLSHTCQDYGESDHEAMMMAIEALSQEPCEAISRAEINKYCDSIISRDSSGDNDIVKAFEAFKVWVNFLPSVQPKPIGCEDAISRADVQLLIVYGDKWNDDKCGTLIDADKLFEDVKRLPSVQPKYNASEWCYDCKEYDHDKHCCPRYNGVIRKAVDEIPKIKTGHWIPKNKNWWECSECGHMIYSETESDKLKFHAFCGRCGAKMVESQESENK